ncbi:MAG: hypothetical protein DMD78_16990 [Candidatus Rokuibacteriota bacterium]|nr:MAG: hypothetical protein DMD78_16990 [Candidatus Rokubacteria bacterium]
MARSHVLIVAEEPAVVEVLSEVIATMADRINVARSAAQALAALSAFRPAATVLDLSITRGIDLLRRIRRDHPRIPMIVIGEAGRSAPPDIGELGVAGYLDRPLDRAAVSLLLTVVLTRRAE